MPVWMVTAPVLAFADRDRLALKTRPVLRSSLEHSPGNSSLIRPASAGFLGYAAVLPEARGLGAGRALGEAILAWSRDAGFGCAATDWRSTNIEADRTWRSLGFRPTFRRLHRLIA